MTEGQPTLTDLITTQGFERSGTLALIAAVEAKEEHPVAEASVRAAGEEGMDVHTAKGASSVTGQGTEAMG